MLLRYEIQPFFASSSSHSIQASKEFGSGQFSPARKTNHDIYIYISLASHTASAWIPSPLFRLSTNFLPFFGKSIHPERSRSPPLCPSRDTREWVSCCGAHCVFRLLKRKSALKIFSSPWKYFQYFGTRCSIRNSSHSGVCSRGKMNWRLSVQCLRFLSILGAIFNHIELITKFEEEIYLDLKFWSWGMERYILLKRNSVATNRVIVKTAWFR